MIKLRKSTLLCLFGLLLLSPTLFSCASSVVQVKQSEASFDLFVDVEPKDAIILIDDVVYGTGNNTAETPLHVTAGTKRVEIRHAGYHPFRTTLEYIQPGEVYTLSTHLIQSEF